MGSRRWTIRGGVCALWLLGVGASWAEGQWLIRGSEPASTGMATGQTTLGRAVVVDGAALEASRMAIDWIDGSRVDVKRHGGDVRSGRQSWFGRIQPGESGVEGDVVFATVGDAVVGTFYTSRGVVALRTDPNTGGRRLIEVDETMFGSCDVEASVVVDAVSTPEWPFHEPATLTVPLAKNGSLVDPPDRVDVLVLYTPDARDGAGGTVAIEATAVAAIASANLALANSGVVPRFTVVHVAEADYLDSGLLVNDLQWLRNHPTVHALRDVHRADLVAMLVEDGGGACGRAYVQRAPGPAFADDAVSVTARSCAVDNLSFAHELAHNLGCEHDPAFGVAPEEASFPWSFGHAEPGAFRTVMAYSGTCGSSGCVRQPLFSSPDLGVDGVPAGVAGARDNARTIDATASIVANFRSRVVPLFHDGFESSTMLNWDQFVPGN